MKHSQEPWSAEKDLPRNILSANGELVACAIACGVGMGAANARRIVACVNSCEGLSTELLEKVASLGTTL